MRTPACNFQAARGKESGRLPKKPEPLAPCCTGTPEQVSLCGGFRSHCCGKAAEADLTSLARASYPSMCTLAQTLSQQDKKRGCGAGSRRYTGALRVVASAG